MLRQYAGMKEAQKAADAKAGRGGGGGAAAAAANATLATASGAGSRNGSLAADEMLRCNSAAFCQGLQTLSVDLYATSIGVGMPFFIAGLIMFCGECAFAPTHGYRSACTPLTG